MMIRFFLHDGLFMYLRGLKVYYREFKDSVLHVEIKLVNISQLRYRIELGWVQHLR